MIAKPQKMKANLPMIRRRMLWMLAGLMYLGVIGCVVWPNPSQAGSAAVGTSQPATRTAAVKGLPYRGIDIQIQRVDWTKRYEHSIDTIAKLGADTVLLVVDARQENGTSDQIYLDWRMTPTPDQLGRLITHAKQQHLRVIVMPIVLLDDPRGDEWRGTLKPDSWDDWFNSYRDMIKQFAWISQAYGANVLVVGSELVSSETHVKQWTRTIGDIRKVFKGDLTYSSNWDHYRSVPFWNQLDLIGMNSYYTLGDSPNVTVPQIEKRWRAIQSDLLAFQQTVHKPLLFLEVGWCSLANAASAPWDYTQTGEPVDLDLQKRLYQAFFNVWYGNPHLGGFMMWEWPPGEGGPEDRGYTPQGKPAENVLQHWLAKKPWKVDAE